MSIKQKLIRNSLMVAGLGACLVGGRPASAAVVLSIEPSTAAPGASGSFDVLLTNTGATAVNIAGFNFTLSTPNTNVTFTDVTTATTPAAYIFPDSLFGPDITTTASAQTVEAGDLDASGNGTSVLAGQTYSLGDVFYDVATTAAVGSIASVSFEPYPDTSLSDMNSNNVGFTDTPGTIAIEPSIAPSPEPSFAWPTAILAAAIAGASWRKRRVTSSEL